jgi:hypothetical protein
MSDSWQSSLPSGEWHQPQAPEGAWRQTPLRQQRYGVATAALILSAIGFGKSKRPGGTGRGPAITGMVNSLALAAVLATGLTVTACSTASAPVNPGGPAASASAQQSGEDPVCTAIASQASSITSQLAADSGNYSAQVPVLQAWEGDLQAAAQKARNSLVQGALQYTASKVEDIVSDEQNLMDGSTSDDTQLNNDFSSYQADVGDLETACGLPS